MYICDWTFFTLYDLLLIFEFCLFNLKFEPFLFYSAAVLSEAEGHILFLHYKAGHCGYGT